MGLISILRTFAMILFMLALAMAPPLALAAFEGAESAGAFLFSLAITLFAAAGFYVASLGEGRATDFRGALIIILLWWAATPIFAGAPFALSGMTMSDAYFEAVAALTTTGGWLSAAAAETGRPAMLWRAELQWLGGFASLAIAAAIFIRPAFIGIDTLLPPFSRGESGNYLRPMRNAVGAFASIYFAATFFAFCALAGAGEPPFNALVIAFSGVASGGYFPGGESEGSPIETLIMFALAVYSGANFVVLARLVRGTNGRVRDVESAAYFGIIFVAAILFWLLSGAGDVDRIGAQLFNAASVLSTNGVVVGEAPPLPVALVTAIIGGAAVSTAGGYKILRWLVIMRRAREELQLLIEPNAVLGERTVSNELGVWIHFLVFTMTLAAVLIVLSIGGASFELATAGAVAALANAGPLIYLAEGGAAGFAAIDAPYRWALAAAMVLGRLEAAVALALINRWFWRA